MTIDDAIKHCKDVIEANEQKAESIKEYNGYTELECMKCAEDHRQLAEWLKELKYAKVLLKATYDLLKQCDDSYFVLNVLEQLVTYDGVECDGYCLMEDIAAFMEEWND